MDLKYIFSVASGVLMMASYIPYIVAILQKKTKPTKASWLIWATLDTITISGMYVEGALNSQILVAGIGSWLVFFLSLKWSIPGWTKLDKFCLCSAFASILVWYISNNPVYGIVISLAISFIGSIPTFASAWKYPVREDRFAWNISWFSSICAVIAIPDWTWADSAQPITFLFIISIMMYILYINQLKPRVS